MNQVIFAGNIQPRDGALKVLDSGQKVCNFTLAVNVGWGDNKKTLWVACAMWGDRAEKLTQYLTKGTAVTVVGDVDLRAFTSNAGEAKAEITCNVQRLTLQGGRRDGAQSEATEKPVTLAQRAAASGSSATVDSDFNDDVPFN